MGGWGEGGGGGGGRLRGGYTIKTYSSSLGSQSNHSLRISPVDTKYKTASEVTSTAGQ